MGDDADEATRTPHPTVWASLQARDALALIDFLVDIVGFHRVAVYADGATVSHAELAWPEGGGVMLGSYKPNAPWSREPGTAGLYVVTDHPDEVFARVSDAGARIVLELKNEDYGSRGFAIADPEGNLWSFGTYRGEPRPLYSV
jgi:uncharacterized glyoxalase superfamily protein PhnB